MFALVSFAVSEINALQRLSLFSLFTLAEDKELEAVALVQRNLMTRMMTAKLFEFLKLFDSICGKKVKGPIYLLDPIFA